MSKVTLTLRVGTHAFKTRCNPEDQESFQNACDTVNQCLEEVRGKEKVADGERAAIMAALRLAVNSQAEKPQLAQILDECLQLASQPVKEL